MSTASLYYSGLSRIVMLTISFLTIGVFLGGLLYKFRLWGSGGSVWLEDPKNPGIMNFVRNILDNLTPSHGIKKFVLNGLIQLREYKQSKFRWFMHMSIFWGFMMLFFLSFFMFLAEFTVPHETYLWLRDSVYVAVWGDFFGYLLLGGIIIAIANRFVNEQTNRTTSSYDWITIILLLVLTVTGFIAKWARPAYLGYGGAEALALFHVAISLGFIAILPYTKLIHLIAAPITQLTYTFEEEEERGVKK